MAGACSLHVPWVLQTNSCVDDAWYGMLASKWSDGRLCAICTQDWGMEICMAMLLLAAFLYLNVLSLIFFLCIGVGMALPEGMRRRTWAMVSPSQPWISIPA
jgi:hypothetical protein